MPDLPSISDGEEVISFLEAYIMLFLTTDSSQEKERKITAFNVMEVSEAVLAEAAELLTLHPQPTGLRIDPSKLPDGSLAQRFSLMVLKKWNPTSVS